MFIVKLVGSIAPNMGMVDVLYDNVWYDVCYDNKKGIQWSFSNVQVLCRELGFPGAMMHKQGDQGEHSRQTIVNSYKCSAGRYICRCI